MYVIFTITILIVITELFLIIKKCIPGFKFKSISKKHLNYNKEHDVKLHEYSVMGDKKIYHGPGKIMIKKDFNVFINTENYSEMIKKNVVYNIETPFELEIVNVVASNERITYYYISL